MPASPARPGRSLHDLMWRIAKENEHSQQPLNAQACSAAQCSAVRDLELHVVEGILKRTQDVQVVPKPFEPVLVALSKKVYKLRTHRQAMS